ncbi:MAG: TrmB family transcriptional regulator [Proteobacteria bacterium]|nr:TrmB family transcriptional regulator [Pseudomonadota bacterium]
MSKSNPPNIDDMLPDLQALGFSEYEARAYLTLYRSQPATAYEVSKLAGLPKANVYAVLDSLTKKEAVQPISENPLRYVVVPPSVLFSRIAEMVAKRCAKLTEVVPHLAQASDDQYVWSVAGKEALAAKMQSMIDSAKSHIWIKSNENLLMPHRDALRRAADRGVAILIILFGSKPEEFDFGYPSRTYLHEGNGIPVGIAHQLMTLTVDFEEAFVAEFRADARGSYTRNRPVVNLADSLLRHEIYFAEIFEMFGEPIQKAFGPALMELRKKYLPTEQVRALERMLRSGDLAPVADARN